MPALRQPNPQASTIEKNAIKCLRASSRQKEARMSPARKPGAPSRRRKASLQPPVSLSLQPQRELNKESGATKKKSNFDPVSFLAAIGEGRRALTYKKKQRIFVQGDPADALFYLQKGRVKLTVLSKTGKEATIGILGEGDFFGEGSLAGQPLRMGSATTLTECTVLQIGKKDMMNALHREHELSDMFVAYLLARNIRYEEDLVDQLFNSSEKRLARVLLLLARFGKEGAPETVLPKISQEVLAEMVGTTRSRVNFFMNRFRKLGFIRYNGGLQVQTSLLTVVLHD
jgi:CRP/FNR family transcriptional regulator, cyclic AMP receptor protein